VPEKTVWLAVVELVNVAKVVRPAMLAAAPSTARDARSFAVRLGFHVRSGKRGFIARSLIDGIAVSLLPQSREIFGCKAEVGWNARGFIG
jgi:hypothetical protein